MDVIQLFGVYTGVEELVQERVGYRATVELATCTAQTTSRFGAIGADWKMPYNVVLCPQADQQEVPIPRTEHTFFIETFNKTPGRVAQEIADLYDQQ